MSNFNDNLESFDVDDKKLPTGLNVLTILTIVWSVISILFTVYGFVKAKTNYEEKDKVIAQMSDPKIPSLAKKFLPDMAHFDEMMTKSYENRVPITLLGIVAIGLCFWGALEMRKRKKQGFLFYTIGSLLPFVTSALFIGAFALVGFISYFMIFISLLFIGMYAVQRKYLS